MTEFNQLLINTSHKCCSAKLVFSVKKILPLYSDAFALIYPILGWRRGVVVITSAQLHSTKPELRFCAGSNPTHGVSEIRDGEDL